MLDHIIWKRAHPVIIYFVSVFYQRPYCIVSAVISAGLGDTSLHLELLITLLVSTELKLSAEQNKPVKVGDANNNIFSTAELSKQIAARNT